jgi:hypothetical protein
MREGRLWQHVWMRTLASYKSFPGPFLRAVQAHVT